jgi:hypothetical protein
MSRTTSISFLLHSASLSTRWSKRKRRRKSICWKLISNPHSATFASFPHQLKVLFFSQPNRRTITELYREINSPRNGSGCSASKRNIECLLTHIYTSDPTDSTRSIELLMKSSMNRKKNRRENVFSLRLELN